MTQETVISPAPSAQVTFTSDDQVKEVKLDLQYPSLSEVAEQFVNTIQLQEQENHKLNPYLNESELISPLFEKPGAIFNELHITQPFDELKPISSPADQLSLSDETIAYETFLTGIHYIVEHIEDPNDPDTNELLFMSLYKALTQFPFEESYELYNVIIEQKIWFKDEASGTFGVDVDKLSDVVYKFLQAQDLIAETQNATAPADEPEEISIDTQGFIDFINSIKPLVEKPEQDEFQPFLDILYQLAQSPYGYELYNQITQEGVWLKDESGDIVFEIEKLPEVLSKFFHAQLIDRVEDTLDQFIQDQSQLADTQDEAISVYKPEEISTGKLKEIQDITDFKPLADIMKELPKIADELLQSNQQQVLQKQETADSLDKIEPVSEKIVLTEFLNSQNLLPRILLNVNDIELQPVIKNPFYSDTPVIDYDSINNNVSQVNPKLPEGWNFNEFNSSTEVDLDTTPAAIPEIM